MASCAGSSRQPTRSGLQQNWLPCPEWKAKGDNVLGIVAPTVEAATQSPWSVTTPQYPQKNLTDTIAVFGTIRIVMAGVYEEKIRKRCPKVTVVQQICSELVGAIKNEAPEAELDRLVSEVIAGVMTRTNAVPPHTPSDWACAPAPPSVEAQPSRWPGLQRASDA